MSLFWMKVSCRRLFCRAQSTRTRNRAYLLYTMLCTADKVKRRIDDKKKKNDDRRKDDDCKKDDDEEDGGDALKSKVLLGTLKVMYDQGWQF